MEKSKAASKSASDVAQVGLKRGGSNVGQQNRQRPHRYDGSAVTAQGLKRAGKTQYASYSTQSKGYDIGRKRGGDTRVTTLPHPGVVKGNTKRVDRVPFA